MESIPHSEKLDNGSSGLHSSQSEHHALSRRGISPTTAAHFQITADRHGWRYPIDPEHGPIRFKAFDSSAPRKYAWLPSKPADARFYDPAGDLAEAVARAGGLLILATGEPDVWAAYEGGLEHVTCTLAGEGSIPAWFTNELRTLGVRRVIYFPDLDEAGRAGAYKVRDALADAGITLELRQLPADLGQAGDLNRLLLHVGPDRFALALMACDRLELPHRVPSAPVVAATPTDAPMPTNSSELAEVEARVRAEIGRVLVKRGTKPGVYACPLDHSHAGKDFLFNVEPGTPIGGCMGKHRGQITRWRDLADQLGIDVARIARDVAHERRPDPVHRALPVAYAGLRYFPHGLPERLIANEDGLGLGVHQNPWFHVAPRDIPNPGALFATLNAYNDAVRAGRIDPERGATLNELADCNPYGVSYATCASGLRHVAATDYFEFWCPYSGKDNIGTKTQKNTPSRGRPADLLRLRPVGEIMAAWLARLGEWVWRALLITRYPDLPAEALALADLLAPEGATLDDIGVIDDVSLPLYEQHDAQLRDALAHLEARMRRVRESLDVPGILAGAYTPLVFADGVHFSNASQYRDAVDDLDPQLRDGVRENRYKAANRAGRSLSAHKRSAERRGILNVPQWTEAQPLAADLPVLPQVERAYTVALQRGRVKLHAPDGATLRLSSTLAERENVDAWLNAHGGQGGASVAVWERTIEKREPLITEAEHQARQEVSDQQRRTGAAQRLADKTARPLTAVDRWLIRQGDLRAALFGLQAMPQPTPRIYFTPTGEIFPLVQVWRAIIQQARMIAAEYDEGDWPPVFPLVETLPVIVPDEADPPAEGAAAPPQHTTGATRPITSGAGDASPIHPF